MPITSADDFFRAIPTKIVRLSTGVDVCIRALNVHAYEVIQAKEDEETDPIKAGNAFSLYAMLFSIVHPETHEPVFAETDLPRLRESLSVMDFESLVLAINEINGFRKEAVEETDPVKKPVTDSEMPTSGTDLPFSSESVPTSSPNAWPIKTLSDGKTSSPLKTGEPITGQPF